MAQSQLALYNLALSIVGMDFTISAVDESSVPAEACQLWYENVRQTILRAAHWNSCKRYVRLTEVTERDLSADWVAGDPEPGFAYSYDITAVTSLLAARYLTDFQQFSIGYDTSNTKKTLSCDVGGSAATDAPILCYTLDVTDATLWEPDLYKAIGFGLAAHITPGTTGKRGLKLDNLAAANQIILEARAANANEMHRYFRSRPTMLGERGYQYTIDTPYIYPYGNLLTSTGAPVA